MAIPPRLPTVVQVLEIAKSFGMTLTEGGRRLVSRADGGLDRLLCAARRAG
jgi:hypothetical protein